MPSSSSTKTISELCREKIVQAHNQYNSGEYRKALSACEYLYTINPSNIDNLLLLGAIHMQLRNLSESIFYNQQCLRSDETCTEAHSNIGNALKELGDVTSASKFLSKAIRVQPRFADAYCNFALAQFQQGNFNAAVESLNAATVLQPGHVDAHCNIGSIFKSIGKLDEAKEAFIEAIRVDPKCAIAWSNLGGIFVEKGDHDSAVKSYRHALQLVPDFPDAFLNLGNTLLEKGLSRSDMNLIQEAAILYEKAVSLRPDFAIGTANLAMSFYHSTKDEEAKNKSKTLLCRSIQFQAKFPDALNNLGILYFEQGRLDDAIKCLIRAIKLKPNHIHAHNNLGNCLIQKGLIEEAIHCYVTATKLKDNFSVAIMNSYSLLESQGLLHDRTSHIKQIMRENPFFVEAHFSLGNAFKKIGQNTDAIVCYERFIESRPAMYEAYFNLAFIYDTIGEVSTAIDLYRKIGDRKGVSHEHYLMARCCDWSFREVHAQEMKSFIKNIEKYFEYIQPLHAQSLSDLNTNEFLQICQAYSKRCVARAKILKNDLLFPRKHQKAGKIRIGYISNSFGNTPVANLTQSIYKLHNREEFEVFCYSMNSTDDSQIFSNIQHGSDYFYDMSSLKAKEIAMQIYDDDIYILVYLDGYTNEELNELFAIHPTPLQITMMGHCGTMGGLFDYLIGDVEVVQNQDNFHEKIIYLEGSFVVNDHKQSARYIHEEESDCSSIRAQYGISDDVFVYACFNQANKIDLVLFSIWMEILHETDQSVLVLLRFNNAMEKNIKKEAIKQKVDPKRIIFVDLLPINEHIRRCRIADLVLDTMICNGMATSCDVLWCGIPIITIAGQHMHNRVGASVMKSIGLEHLIVKSLDEYKKLAISLNHDEETYINIIRYLEKQGNTCDLFNTSKWVVGFEAALKRVVTIDKLGCPPKHIHVASL